MTAVSMSEGCSVIWAELCFPMFCLLSKRYRGFLIKDISVKATEEYYNAAGSRKSKTEMRERPNNDSPLPEVCLCHLFKGKNTLWIKCHRQILVPSHRLPAHPNRSSQASQTEAGDFLWGMFPTPLPQRLLPSTMWWWRKPKHYCLATSADVVAPGKIIVNSFYSESIENLLKYKRSKTWPRQLHNWGTIRVLTAFTFKFLPKSPGIAAG